MVAMATQTRILVGRCDMCRCVGITTGGGLRGRLAGWLLRLAIWVSPDGLAIELTHPQVPR